MKIKTSTNYSKFKSYNEICVTMLSKYIGWKEIHVDMRSGSFFSSRVEIKLSVALVRISSSALSRLRVLLIMFLWLCNGWCGYSLLFLLLLPVLWTWCGPIIGQIKSILIHFSTIDE